MAKNESNQSTAAIQEAAASPQFNLLRQYLKDASVEFPGSPQIFKDAQENTLNLQLNSNYAVIEDSIYEVVLKASLDIINPAKKTVMLIECQYAGIFEIRHVEKQEMDVLLNVHALEILFPFVRELVSSLSMRTSLPPILLPPTNFVQMYQQRVQAENAPKATSK
jgi:preprotein translocase subunit SecB